MLGKRDLQKAKKLKKTLEKQVKELKYKALLQEKKNHSSERNIISIEKSIEDMKRIIKKHKNVRR